MPNRNWTSDQRGNQSKLIMEQKPWEYSTGPKTMMGTYRSKMNALKHGFSTESLREFRKSSRRVGVRELENLCKELIKSIKKNDFEEVMTLSSHIDNKFSILSKDFERENQTPELLMENYYTIILLSKTLSFSIRICFKKLRATFEEQL